MRSSRHRSTGSPRPWMTAFVSSLAILAAVAATQVTSPHAASAANVVNETFQFPLMISMNTCSTPMEPVALNGDLHIVVTTTSDSSGGYHVTTGSNTESVTGTGLISGLKYSSSTSDQDEYYDGGPFPEVHTMTHNYVLISQGGTANTVMKVTFHVTVDGNGIPTAAVDDVKSGCQG
jgi:hypothetical protein